MCFWWKRFEKIKEKRKNSPWMFVEENSRSCTLCWTDEQILYTIFFYRSRKSNMKDCLWNFRRGDDPRRHEIQIKKKRLFREVIIKTRLLLSWKRKTIDIRNFIILYLICMLFGCLYFEENVLNVSNFYIKCKSILNKGGLFPLCDSSLGHNTSYSTHD